MMKKIFTALFVFLFLFVLVGSVSAQMGMMGTASGDRSNLDTEVNNILKSQNIDSAKNIDCSKVTDDQFEKIGDVWMDYQIGNEAIHERMDNMMGGEGSDQLKNAHIQMGKNYLGCSESGNYNGMPMMEYSNGNEGSWNGMMGFNGMAGTGGGQTMFLGHSAGFSGIHLVLALITWISLIMFLLTGTRYFWKNIKR